MAATSSISCAGIFLAMAVAPCVAQPEPGAASGPAAAQPCAGSVTDIQALPAIKVKGQRLDPALPPGTTITVRETLAERSIESWDDFGKRAEPGVTFSRLNNSINIRGMDQDRVVTRVDGVRIPWLNDGARGVKGGLDSVDFGALSGIDLVRSSGAAQSGSLVGHVDLHTLSPHMLVGPDRSFGALVKSGYDSADESWGAEAALAGRLGQGTTWLVQAGRRKGHELANQGSIGGYGPLRDKRNPESYTQRNVLLKLEQALPRGQTISLTGERFRRNAEIDNRLEQGTAAYGRGNNQSSKQISRERVLLGYDIRPAGGWAGIDEGSVKLYWQRSSLLGGQSALRNMDGRGRITFGPRFPVGAMFGLGYPYGRYERDNTVAETDVGLTTQWRGHLHAGALVHHWAIGGEWSRTTTRQHSGGYDNCPENLRPWPAALQARLGPRNCDLLHSNQADMPEARGRVAALWAQDELSWAGGRYALTPALRLDSYRYTPQAGGAYASNPNAPTSKLAPASGHRLSPSLLATFRPGDDLSLYARYGYGYRAPNATELYMNYGAPGTYLRVGNAGLKPEVSRGWELGADIGTQDLGGRIAVFENRYRNYIDENVPLNAALPGWNPAWSTAYPMGVMGFANRDRVLIRGAEASARWNIDSNWHAWGSLAWARGRDQDTGRSLNSVAPLKVLTALGYRAQQWGAEAIATFTRRRTHVEYPAPQKAPGAPAPDFQAPGYGLLDLNAWWKPQGIKGLRLQAGIYNVFDKTYWNALNVPRLGGRGSAPLDSYTEPGRSVRVSMTYQY